MTADRDLDRQLGAWLDSRATMAAPEGLLERTLDRVGTTPQRPGWLVRDRWWSRRRMGHPEIASARARRLVAVAVAVVVVAAGAGVFLKLSPAMIGRPSSAPSIAPSPAATVAPSPSPTPAGAGLPARAGQFDRVCDFGLASNTVGWASTSSGLYRTEDTGKTWSAVQPPRWSAATYTTSIFVDADTAYSFLAGSPTTMAATHDGGATWVETVLDVGATSVAPVFSFQTPSSGSVIFFGQLKSDPVHLYATTDGGATWTGPKSGVGAVGPPGCGHQGLTPMFALTNPQHDNKPFDNLLQLSSDGGATWVNRQLPVSTISPKNSLKWVEGLWGDGSGRVVMLLSVEGAEQLYTSGDDGRTWQLLRTFGQLVHGYLLPEFLSATAWVFVAEDASVVFSTVDGGATWRTTAGSAFKVRSASFGSPDLGWASVSCGGLSYTPDNPVCATSAKGTILVTTDGGQTWAPIGQ